jgi:hypothetical protein
MEEGRWGEGEKSCEVWELQVNETLECKDGVVVEKDAIVRDWR